MAIAIPVIRDF